MKILPWKLYKQVYKACLHLFAFLHFLLSIWFSGPYKVIPVQWDNMIYSIWENIIVNEYKDCMEIKFLGNVLV